MQKFKWGWIIVLFVAIFFSGKVSAAKAQDPPAEGKTGEEVIQKVEEILKQAAKDRRDSQRAARDAVRDRKAAEDAATDADAQRKAAQLAAQQAEVDRQAAELAASQADTKGKEVEKAVNDLKVEIGGVKDTLAGHTVALNRAAEAQENFNALARWFAWGLFGIIAFGFICVLIMQHLNTKDLKTVIGKESAEQGGKVDEVKALLKELKERPEPDFKALVQQAMEPLETRLQAIDLTGQSTLQGVKYVENFAKRVEAGARARRAEEDQSEPTPSDATNDDDSSTTELTPTAAPAAVELAGEVEHEERAETPPLPASTEVVPAAIAAEELMPPPNAVVVEGVFYQRFESGPHKKGISGELAVETARRFNTNLAEGEAPRAALRHGHLYLRSSGLYSGKPSSALEAEARALVEGQTTEAFEPNQVEEVQPEPTPTHPPEEAPPSELETDAALDAAFVMA